MKLSKLQYPAPLGRRKQNYLKSQGDKITQGMWVNLNAENYGEPPKWAKTTATGTIIDRGLGFQRWGRNYNDLAIFCHYPNPQLEMMMFSLLPVDSPLFDMDTDPSRSAESRLIPLPVLNPSPIRPPFDGPSVTPPTKIGPLLVSSALAFIILAFPIVAGEGREGNP